MRKLQTALATVLMLGFAPTVDAAQIVAPSSVPLSQTVVALAAGVDQVLGIAKNRRYLCVMNIGTGLVNLGFDAAAVAGAGWAIEGAAADGHQGGAMCWEASVVAGSVVHAVSADGSAVAVIEGR
jgi:hypothetical protein